MLLSPPVLPRVSAFSGYFPQFRIGVAEVIGQDLPDTCLLLLLSSRVYAAVNIRASLRGRCLTDAAISPGKTTKFIVGEAEFPRPILICPTHAGFPPRSPAGELCT